MLKPPGMTSSDAVVDIRKIFGIKRVGHTGTLDPGAAGVLPICIGRATRLFDYLVDKKKQYVAELCIGADTDTQDSYGTAVAFSDESAVASVDAARLNAVLPEFTGRLMQLPPMYSAVRSQGKKLYQLARSGVEVERTPREVNIEGIELIDVPEKGRFLLRIDCSRGTYVRTLCHDIAKRMGVCGHMSFLLRTRSGLFELDKTYSIAELEQMKREGRLESSLTRMDEAISFMPQLRLDGLSAVKKRLLVNGATVEVDVVAKAAGREIENECFRVYCGGFVGVGRPCEDGFRIDTMLREDTE